MLLISWNLDRTCVLMSLIWHWKMSGYLSFFDGVSKKNQHWSISGKKKFGSIYFSGNEENIEV